MSAQIWEFLGRPSPVQACPDLVDHPSPLPLLVRTQGWHFLKHRNLRTIRTEG